MDIERVLLVTVDLNPIDVFGQRFVDFLYKENITLTGDKDGRDESKSSEDVITDALRKEFPNINFLDKDNNRAFGDICIDTNGKVYPINVKIIGETTGNYNAGGPKLLNYILFGDGDINWINLVKKIKNNKPTEIHSEYYYLIYYKGNKKPQFISFTDIDSNSITVNPTNPIQLKQNLMKTSRTEKQKVDFLIDLVDTFVTKRAKPYLEWIS